ncbi:hypothetical protein [Streptomyces sp. NPDC052192]|uniref:hypothetical protein n=1 Tax=Streptomyces sp. NPDC052192 TaxID=3155052 RepID=UPI0034249489
MTHDYTEFNLAITTAEDSTLEPELPLEVLHYVQPGTVEEQFVRAVGKGKGMASIGRGGRWPDDAEAERPGAADTTASKSSSTATMSTCLSRPTATLSSSTWTTGVIFHGRRNSPHTSTAPYWETPRSADEGLGSIDPVAPLNLLKRSVNTA